MASYIEHKIRTTFQTTNATPTTLASFTVSDETSVSVEAWVMGRESSSTDSGAHFLRAVYARESGSTYQMYESSTELYDSASHQSASLSLNINDIVVLITGTAAVTINWVCFVTIMVYTP